MTRLEESSRTGEFDEEFRIVRPDHAIRWVWSRGFPVRDSAGVIRRLVGVTQDVTARKCAEEQRGKNLALAESAWAEADAFRKTTLALTQNLSMDYVLDTLLQSLLKLIPCDSARVLLMETDTRLFLAREVQHPEKTRRHTKCPSTLDAEENRFLKQVLTTKGSMLIPNTSEEKSGKASRDIHTCRHGFAFPSLHRSAYWVSCRSAIRAPTLSRKNICAWLSRLRSQPRSPFRTHGFMNERKSMAWS